MKSVAQLRSSINSPRVPLSTLRVCFTAFAYFVAASCKVVLTILSPARSAITTIAETLDEALTRPGRFDYQVSVDLPDTYGREKIFAIHTRKMKLASKVNLRDFAIRTPQFFGADIEQACCYVQRIFA